MRKLAYNSFLFLIMNTTLFANPHGKDLRKEISLETVKNSPYRMIGQLSMGCTGTVIGPRHILTAAHCFFIAGEHALGEFPVGSVSFRPMSAGGQTSGDHYRAKKFLYNEKKYDRTSRLRWGHDYGVIVLEENIQKYGSLPIKKAPLFSKRIKIAGYPGDREDLTLWESKCSSRMTLFAKRQKYSCDTAPGMSGAAIRKVIDGREHIIGVHIMGGFRKNSGVHFNSKKVKQIKKWVRENL